MYSKFNDEMVVVNWFNDLIGRTKTSLAYNIILTEDQFALRF